MSKTYKSKLSFRISQLKNFLKIFFKDKRAIAGVSIILFYSIIAIGAPLIAPISPYERYVAGDYAYPTWWKYVTGNPEQYNENFELHSKGFPTPDLLQPAYWDFSTPSPYIDLIWNGTMGSPLSGPGCAQIILDRPGTTPLGKVSATMSKTFQFTSVNPPKRFSATITVKLEGAENVPIQVRIFIGKESSNATNLWVWQEARTTNWTTPSYALDSYESTIRLMVSGDLTIDAAQVIFAEPGNYTFGVEATFNDEKAQPVKASVFIDDLSLKLYGNTFGWLGTNHEGRDIFSQLIYGARISLFVGLLSAAISVILGLIVGVVSGYVGGIVDEIAMRFTDALLVIPTLPLLLVLVAVLGSSIWNLIMIIGVLGWMGFARTVRSQTLSLKERPFIEAAKAAGSGTTHIITTHILPNVMTLVYVSLALSVPSAILSEAALSWLGLFDPTVVSWGRMLYDVQYNQGVDKPWWVIPPGVSIALVSLSFILLGYALDEVLNPKLRQRR
ncbi:MAG: ABC transporter permease [Candidatus Bathyarchaeia archaeon]